MELIIDKNGKAVSLEDVSVTIICESKEEADRMKEGMADGRVRLMEWHPIELRDGEIVGLLPEYDEDIIITHKGTMGQSITSVSYFDGDFRTEDGEGYFGDVIAWAPLPAPYKPRKEEGTT